MSDDISRDDRPPTVDDPTSADPATAAAQTLRSLELYLDRPAATVTVALGDAEFDAGGSRAGLPGDWERDLLASLSVDAVIDTNELVQQRSLRDFLR